MLQCYCGEHLKAVDRNESFKMTQLMCPKDDGQTMHFGAWMFDPKLELAKEHGRTSAASPRKASSATCATASKTDAG